MKRGTPLKRTQSLARTPLAPKRNTPRRRSAPKWTAEEWEAANLLLMIRGNGCCECCGTPLNGRSERHHRVRRRDGGDRYSNILLLLPEHHADITLNPEISKENGWIVPPWADPMDVPVLLNAAWFWLDDDGTKTQTTRPQEQTLFP